jgi:beta-galactosidase/beta-glucuronidase
VAAQSAQLKLVVNSPKLWSPDTPALYTAIACWGSDFALNTTIKFGIKHLTTNGSAFLLNGAALYIHGVGDDFTCKYTSNHS